MQTPHTFLLCRDSACKFIFCIHTWSDLGAFCDEHGEWFHQDIVSLEKLYGINWNLSMLADY